MRLVIVCLLLAGCATTSTTLHPSSPSVTGAFAEEPDSIPTLCTADAQDPRVTAFDEQVDRKLVAGLVDGSIAIERWRSCVDAFTRVASTPQLTALGTAVSRGYSALLLQPTFETETALQQRLRAMQDFYVAVARVRGAALPVDEGSFAELRGALAAQKLGPKARSLTQELFTLVDLEHDTYRGRTVDVSLLDELCKQADMDTLRRMAAHLPTDQLREDARRRVIRLLIASSSFPTVREDANQVEERVLATGVNAIELDRNKPLSASLDPLQFPYRGVLVEQDLARQSARLVGYTGDQPSGPALLEVELRGVLSVQVEGISSPVTVCRSHEEPDVSPCIAPSDIRIGDALGKVDEHGTFRFADAMPMVQAVALGAKADRIALSVWVGGRSLLTMNLGLSYAPPGELVTTTPVAGGNAPDLSVTVDHRYPARFVFATDDGHTRRLAVVEAADVASFRLESVGGQGASGTSGTSGMSGMSGGECGSGTSGSDGGDGSDGGPGGDGGNITVRVLCNATRCDDDVRALRQVFLSVGGAGGIGGAGGAGGSGGAAGSGRQPWIGFGADGDHTVLEEGCRGGSAGSDGSSGRDGSPGAPGHAGQVRFVP